MILVFGGGFVNGWNPSRPPVSTLLMIFSSRYAIMSVNLPLPQGKGDGGERLRFVPARSFGRAGSAREVICL